MSTAHTGNSGPRTGDRSRTPIRNPQSEIRNAVKRQIRLPLGKAVGIAWRSLRVRVWRSALVTAGVVLALAFLAYILGSEALVREIERRAPPELLDALRHQGALVPLDAADARLQTWWLVGLALAVSFVGILNAMLMSVAERYAEIGTMKCLGALDRLVLELFLLETAFQGIAGTVLGIALGLSLALVEGWVRYGGAAMRFVPGGELARIAGLAAAVGMVLTVASALYPAWRAARMQPVDAMRTEV
jgi:hypothetical protein